MPRAANPADSSTSGETPSTKEQHLGHPRGVGCGPCADGTAAIPGAQQGTVCLGGGGQDGPGPSILYVASGTSGGSCHAPAQQLWAKLGRMAGMASGACEPGPLPRLPRELHPCFVCTAAAPLPQPRHVPRPPPAPSGPGTALGRLPAWPGAVLPSQHSSSPSAQRLGASGDRSHAALLTRSLRAAPSLTSPGSASPPGRQDTPGSSSCWARRGTGGFWESDESVNGFPAPVTHPERKSQP